VDSTTICGLRFRRDTPGSARSARYPKPDCPIQVQPSILHEFLDFPIGDNADAEDAVSATFENVAVSRQ
jgi:hypothetical protein